MVRTYTEEQKARKKESNRKWHEANREKKKERNREYREANSEKIKEYREANREKENERRRRKYLEANCENQKERYRKYRQTDAGKKTRRISDWKRSGVIGDFEELYERYLTTHWCDECECELTIDRVTTATTKCLDHDHETGEFRNILCNSCNVKRG